MYMKRLGRGDLASAAELTCRPLERLLEPEPCQFAPYLYFMGSDDGNYTAHLGVHDGMWTFDPDVNGNLQLGTANHKWGSLYAKNGAIQTSDRTLKKDIREIDDKYIDFFMHLMPVSFKFNDGIRTHIGFVSQDVETAMTAAELTDLDFAGFCKLPRREKGVFNGMMI